MQRQCSIIVVVIGILREVYFHCLDTLRRMVIEENDIISIDTKDYMHWFQPSRAARTAQSTTIAMDCVKVFTLLGLVAE